LLKDFGNNPILKDDYKLNCVQHAQFHLVIENCKLENYFTEKLTDALSTKTIPIYYGCSNITDFFDTTGWIILDSLDFNDFLKKISVIDDKYYMKYCDIIEKNFIKVQKYNDIINNINRALEQIPDY
jgi:hypothetical protein